MFGLQEIINKKINDLKGTLFYQIHHQFTTHHVENPLTLREDSTISISPFPESVTQPLYELFNKFGDAVYNHMDKLDHYDLQETTTRVKETFTFFRKSLFEKKFVFPSQGKHKKLEDFFFKRCVPIAIKQLCKRFQFSFDLAIQHLKEIAKPKRSVTSAMTEEDNVPLKKIAKPTANKVDEYTFDLQNYLTRHLTTEQDSTMDYINVEATKQIHGSNFVEDNVAKRLEYDGRLITDKRFPNRLYNILTDFNNKIISRLSYLIRINPITSKEKLRDSHLKISNITSRVYEVFVNKLVWKDVEAEILTFMCPEQKDKEYPSRYLQRALSAIVNQLISVYRNVACPEAMKALEAICEKEFGSEKITTEKTMTNFLSAIPVGQRYLLSELTSMYNTFFGKNIKPLGFARLKAIKGKFDKSTVQIN